jgi:serine/threonine protein kinase
VTEAIRLTTEPGSTIANRYVVEDSIGQGGMATVYKVRDTQTGAFVALKRGLARDPAQVLKRQVLLQREYHTLEQLRHPRIIEVYDYGIDSSGPYYTMELLDGADLDCGGRLPWREACAVLRDVASSLAIVHARGLLHRDVSPRNVRRTADGRAKLMDFGAMTTTGVSIDAVGTPPFIAPEVLQMQPLDSRADLFSL